MNSELNLLKGIHPGLVLNRELDKRHLRKGAFALSLQEYPQTLTAITKGKRGMNTALSLKIEKALGLEEGYFMILQVYYEIEEEKRDSAVPITASLKALTSIGVLTVEGSESQTGK